MNESSERGKEIKKYRKEQNYGYPELAVTIVHLEIAPTVYPGIDEHGNNQHNDNNWD